MIKSSALLALAVGIVSIDGAHLLKAREPIPGSYVAVFSKGVSKATRAPHMSSLAKNNATNIREYTIGEHFQGYAARLNPATLQLILASEEVEFVEEDGVMRMNSPDTCNQQKGATWGLVRTSERALRIDGDYKYLNLANGKGVTAYVIDTGIYLQHDEFKGRAKWGTNTVDNDNSDGNGHGTHVAGTIGGTTYGLAKEVDLVAVKVLSAEGTGSTAGVIAGVEWTANNHKKPAVANLSLGGGKSTALNNAASAAVRVGVTMVVAAGNENEDACKGSPSSSTDCITVAASDTTDTRATFSNFGSCVNIYGPGVGITSAWINAPDSINTISGTSMASPHVAGEVAKYLSSAPDATPQMAAAFVESEASQDTILQNIKSTPNLLLFGDCTVFDDLSNWDLIMRANSTNGR